MHLPVRIAARFRDDPGLRTALIYALVAGVWILASDWLLELLFSDPGTFTKLATLKGWGFVAVTSLMLYGLVRRDIAEIKRAEREVQLNLTNQKALLDVYQKMSAAQVEEITAFVVDKCVSLTGSVIGFVGLVSEDGQRMEAHIWSETAMEKPLNVPLSDAGLWAEPIRQCRTIIVNDFREADRLEKGCPQWHLELSRFMGVPVVDKGRVVAVAGVANKREDYAQADEYNVSLLLKGMWDLIKRKRAEDELRTLNEELEGRVKARVVELKEKNADLEKMIKVFVGRELRMVELKERIRELEAKTGIVGAERTEPRRD